MTCPYTAELSQGNTDEPQHWIYIIPAENCAVHWAISVRCPENKVGDTILRSA